MDSRGVSPGGGGGRREWRDARPGPPGTTKKSLSLLLFILSVQVFEVSLEYCFYDYWSTSTNGFA